MVTWNEQYQKLTTSDQNGLIIVWMLYKGILQDRFRWDNSLCCEKSFFFFFFVQQFLQFFFRLFVLQTVKLKIDLNNFQVFIVILVCIFRSVVTYKMAFVLQSYLRRRYQFLAICLVNCSKFLIFLTLFLYSLRGKYYIE